MSINTLDTPLTSWLALDRHLDWYFAHTRLELDWHLIDRQLVDSWQVVGWLMCSDHQLMTCLQKLVDCQPRCKSNIGQVSIEMSLERWSRCKLIVDWSSVYAIHKHSTADTWYTWYKNYVLYELEWPIFIDLHWYNLFLLTFLHLHQVLLNELNGSEKHRPCNYSKLVDTSLK